MVQGETTLGGNSWWTAYPGCNSDNTVQHGTHEGQCTSDHFTFYDRKNYY